MTTIAFIGLGNMGCGMALRQAAAGRRVLAYDIAADAVAKAVAGGCAKAAGLREAAAEAAVVVTMLPAGPQVREVYAQLLASAPASALLIDCSTVDVDCARAVAAQAKAVARLAGPRP